MVRKHNDFVRHMKAMADYFKQGVLDDVATLATEIFRDKNFNQEAFDGEKWPNRKREKRAGRISERGQRGLLVKSGRLRQSIDSEIRGNSVVIKAGYDVNGYNLAEIHNEGQGLQPKRQFMGDSKELEKAVEKRIERSLDKIFK